MVSSDEVYLSKIVKRSLYCDKESKELITLKKKPKYKLAGNPILEKYFFHVLTTTKDACKKAVTLIINREDWEERAIDQYLPKETGYCDLRKYEIMDRSELLGKMKDKKNGFPYVAKLCIAKYDKLQKLKEKMKYNTLIPNEIKRIVMDGLSDRVDEIALKLGLK